MCGISFILEALSLNFTNSITNSTHHFCSLPNNFPFRFTLDELKAALWNRGPDSLGTKRVSFNFKDDGKFVCFFGGDDEFDKKIESLGKMYFFGAVLQLRGTIPVVQPFVDGFGNVLVYNGEIFGGVHVSFDSNDARVLLESLQNCCSCKSHVNESTCSGKSIPELLSSIKGPWAVIYWQDTSRTLWFGRDAFGRRSLLVHWPTSEDCRLILSSVSPPASTSLEPDPEVEGTESNLAYWEELPCGIYSIVLDASSAGKCLDAKLSKYEWTSSMLKDLINWQRNLIEPSENPNLLATSINGVLQSSTFSRADRVLAALRKSVRRRTSQNSIFKATIPDDRQGNLVPVAVLFSGGLDSMILAAILHESIDSKYGIDLLNVSFEGELAPDRITARSGLKELKNIAPLRRWKLVEIDAELSKLTMEMKHVTSLINPAKTYMDLNIGLALWLAAGGNGWVHEEDNFERMRYKSEARILLVGSGADEQCAGYGRHRTKFRNSSWLGLNEEMKLDMQRIWKRNLGRDDRCIADNGKEARFPFLDEDVIQILLDFPLWEIANLNQPSGTGDKKILREVARLLGLHEAALQPKRAIQFGSRIAQESNRKNFGSNRAANQASAGSVVFYK